MKKKNLILILMLFIQMTSLCQYRIDWQNCYGTDEDDVGGAEQCGSDREHCRTTHQYFAAGKVHAGIKKPDKIINEGDFHNFAFLV